MQNLRASRENDLSRDFPLKVAADWIGNSPRIALKHYLGITEADFAKGADYQSTISKTPQNPPQQPAQVAGNRGNSAEAESGVWDISAGASTAFTAVSSAFLPQQTPKWAEPESNSPKIVEILRSNRKATRNPTHKMMMLGGW
jgi:hypothetical protein